MKRIVICADGTWNLRDQLDKDTGKIRPTNVTKVARAVLPRDAHGVDQVVFYLDGVGTGGYMDKFTGGAFGHGIERNVRELYRSIIYSYCPGDELYFFGFSRGAFTVRTLAGLMNRIGLLDKDEDFFLPEIYACYERNKGPGTPEWEHAFRKVTHPKPCPPIKFIGVWDTVGSLGAPGVIGKIASKLNGNKYAYHDVTLNPRIQNAFHALALDERRNPFAPSLWKRPADWPGELEQAWFPGVHCSVGGGYTPDGLANEALHWMVEKAEHLDLEFDPKYLKPFTPCFNSKRHDSMTLKYRVFGKYVRPVGQHLDDGERIHQSVMDRRGYYDGKVERSEPWVEEYAPENLKAFLEALRAKEAPTPLATTLRVPRGEPCPMVNPC